MKAFRVIRNGDVYDVSVWNVDHYNRYSFEKIPKDIKEKLAVLMTCPKDYYNQDVGHVISDTVFAVFIDQPSHEDL